MRRAKLFLVALLIALAPFTFPETVRANNQWWSTGQLCDNVDNHGSYQLGLASLNGIVACGPGPSAGGVDHEIIYSGASVAEYEWECVEYSMRYMYLTYGVQPWIIPSAAGLVSSYTGTRLIKVANNGFTLPTIGDVVSMGYGHTAVIAEVNVTNGNGTVKVIEQNYASSTPGYHTISVVNNVLHDSVINWLHDPNGGRVATNLLQIENTGSGWQIYNITTATSNQQISGKPGILWPSSSQPNIFASDPAGALRQFTTCASGWCNYKITSDNALSGGLDVVQSSGGIEVFAPSTDGSLLQIEFNGSTWNIYNLTSALGGLRIKGPPGVFWESGGQPNIFAVDEFGALRQFTPCTSGWCSYILSGQNTYSSGANAMKNGSAIEVVARSSGGHLYQVENTGSGWTTFDMSIATGNVNITGTPGIYATGSTMHLYASDFNYALRQFALCPTSGWCTYELTGYNAVSDGADAVLRTNTIEVFSASR